MRNLEVLVKDLEVLAVSLHIGYSHTTVLEAVDAVFALMMILKDLEDTVSTIKERGGI